MSGSGSKCNVVGSTTLVYTDDSSRVSNFSFFHEVEAQDRADKMKQKGDGEPICCSILICLAKERGREGVVYIRIQKINSLSYEHWILFYITGSSLKTKGQNLMSVKLGKYCSPSYSY